MDLNLQPYPLLKIDDFTYSFTTAKNIEYLCSFLKYGEYFPNHPAIASKIYSFNVELRDRKIKPKALDRRIADTVIMIVGNFLESLTNAVVYVCDNSDGKEAVRARKFKSWFNYFDHPSLQIIQINSNFYAGA